MGCYFKATDTHQKSLYLLLSLLVAHLRVRITGWLAHYPAQMDIVQTVIFFSPLPQTSFKIHPV